MEGEVNELHIASNDAIVYELRGCRVDANGVDAGKNWRAVHAAI
jgi:hypothetical protein